MIGPLDDDDTKRIAVHVTHTFTYTLDCLHNYGTGPDLSCFSIYF